MSVSIIKGDITKLTLVRARFVSSNRSQAWSPARARPGPDRTSISAPFPTSLDLQDVIVNAANRSLLGTSPMRHLEVQIVLKCSGWLGYRRRRS